MPIGNDATTYAKGNPDDTITSVNDSDEYASDLNRGALNDAKDMQRLGKKQELRVKPESFSFFSFATLLLIRSFSETSNSSLCLAFLAHS